MKKKVNYEEMLNSVTTYQEADNLLFKTIGVKHRDKEGVSCLQIKNWRRQKGAAKDIVDFTQKLLDKTRNLYQAYSGEEDLQVFHGVFADRLGLNCNFRDPDLIVVGDPVRGVKTGKMQPRLKVYATIQKILNYTKEEVYKETPPSQPSLTLQMSNTDYVPRCQFEALVKRVEILENKEKKELSTTGNNNWNMSQFRRTRG